VAEVLLIRVLQHLAVAQGGVVLETQEVEVLILQQVVLILEEEEVHRDGFQLQLLLGQMVEVE
jgi:hypothetical protein